MIYFYDTIEVDLQENFNIFDVIVFGNGLQL